MLTTPKENKVVILHLPALGGEYHTKLTYLPSKQSTRLTCTHLSRGLVNTTKRKFTELMFPLAYDLDGFGQFFTENS